MPRTKNEALTIRTTGEVKGLPALAAERVRCFAASMVEMLDYAKAYGLAVATKGRLRERTPARKPRRRFARENTFRRYQHMTFGSLNRTDFLESVKEVATWVARGKDCHECRAAGESMPDRV